LEPIQRIYDERYSVYFPLTTLENWETDKKKWDAADQLERNQLAMMTDEVHAGEQQSERDHNMLCYNSTNPTFTGVGLPSRQANIGGWFSYDMKSDPKDSMQLLCTYWGSDKINREFDIMIDGVVIGTQVLYENNPGNFFDVIYNIPPALTKGKTSITVKFQPKTNKIAGSVYKVRTLRAQNNITFSAPVPYKEQSVFVTVNQEGNLAIKGLQTSTLLTIYNATGILIISKFINNTDAPIMLNQKGMYIVKLADMAFKVVR
jgi:hypothetical protein